MTRYAATLVVMLAVARPVSAQPFVVDHTNLVPINQIPVEHIVAAQQIQAMTIGRSVGQNIDNGLTCLSFTYATAPTNCKKNLLPELIWTGAFSRSHFTALSWGGSGVPNAIQPPCSLLSNGLWTGYQPQWICESNARWNDHQVFSFQFDYLTATWSDSVANYFTARPGNYDVYDYINFKNDLATAGKTSFMWTANLADAGQSEAMLARLRDYNVLARQQWTQDQILFDIADLESYDQFGNPCTYLGYPVICPVWKSSGGHLNASGQIRAATGYWNVFARLAGYVP